MVSRLLVMVLGSGLSMYFLTSVIPLYLAANGSAGIGPGLATGAMMFSAVAVELLVPRMLARWGYRVVLALGVILMGAPALALLFTSSLPIVVLVCAIRGAGLGINVVGFKALFAIAAVMALAVLGLATGIPTRTTTEESHVKVLSGLRGSGLLMPSLVFAGVTLAAGISITFLPLAIGNHSLAATALFLQAVTAPLARWLAGTATA